MMPFSKVFKVLELKVHFFKSLYFKKCRWKVLISGLRRSLFNPQGYFRPFFNFYLFPVQQLKWHFIDEIHWSFRWSIIIYPTFPSSSTNSSWPLKRTRQTESGISWKIRGCPPLKPPVRSREFRRHGHHFGGVSHTRHGYWYLDSNQDIAKQPWVPWKSVEKPHEIVQAGLVLLVVGVTRGMSLLRDSTFESWAI